MSDYKQNWRIQELLCGRYRVVMVVVKKENAWVMFFKKEISKLVYKGPQDYFGHGGTRDSANPHLHRGTLTLTPMPEAKEGADAALSFQDWIELSYAVMCDLSEGSSEWWAGVIDVVEQSYAVWLAASPIEKLSIEPRGTEKWCTGKWTRVNARASSMLLTSMPAELRSEMVSRRYTHDCTKMMFKLFTAYQPGGSAERHDVLRRLQAPLEFAGGESLDKVLRAVRSWPRWLERCKAVQMTPPDASVLARGLLALTSKHIESSSDASFRTSMLRASLRLDARPTLEQVQAYQRHLQAELEVMALSMTTTSPPPKVQAVESTQAKARDAAPKGTSTELCRYFAKASGCRRGDKCAYSHSMSGMEKEQRAKKCLKCGSEAHRQRDCTVGRAPAKTHPGSPSREGKDQRGLRTPSSSNQEQRATPSTAATVATAAPTMSETVAGTPWTLEALVQAAQQVIQTQGSENRSESSPEKTKPEVKTLILHDIRICSLKGSATALVDSGATHSLRTSVSEEEWEAATTIEVQLAGTHRLTMRITATGTLLMPPRPVDLKGPTSGQTIVPMGQLIQVLGYSMYWSTDECYLQDLDGSRIPLQVEGGCPQLQELEALTLIARLEDRKLEELRNATLLTEDHVRMSAVAMEKTWDAFLLDYVANGAFDSGLRAVRDAPFFRDVPGECLSNLVPMQGLWSGWDIMKQVGFFTRAQRRKILTSKRWVVHLFAGREGHWEIMKLDQGDTTVIELDLDRCHGMDILRSETWRMLLWGAREGKIDAIIGGPPGRGRQHARGGQRDSRSVTLVARMLWLHAVAQVGREVNGGTYNHNREVAFMLEYPEGTTEEQREMEERRIEQIEQEFRSPPWNAAPRVATWGESQRYWEEVQRPRLQRLEGGPTMDGGLSFWDTRMWKAYQEREGLRVVKFDQGATGGASKNRTGLGTNIHSLLALNELRVDPDDDLPEKSDKDAVWSPGLVNAVVVALSFWDRDPRCAPRLPQMNVLSAEQWKEHVASNHEVFRKECVTCVTSRGTGKQHRRVHHPEAYVLTADIAGPLARGLDATSKGTMGKNLKYLLAIKYVVPKSFITLHTGGKPPEDDGCPAERPQEDALTKEQEQLLEELFGPEDSAVRGGEEAEVEVGEDLLPSTAIVPEEHGELDEYVLSAEEDEEEEAPAAEPAPQDVVMEAGDCLPPELTYLTFGVGLPNNQAGTVKKALQDAVLYLQMHGFPIYRFHADKGEFFNHGLRNWLREQGVYATWSEVGIPQGNGRAENTVRWLKDRIRTLLVGAKLPTRLWPVAAAAAAAQQRARVLNWRTCLAAPFGATVYLKRKAFDRDGPQRREHALESKWTKGVYVGLSTILRHGHLVYIPAEGDEREKFLHTAHVRANLMDPGEPEEVLYEEVPRPRRRLSTKTDPEGIELRSIGLSKNEATRMATDRSEQLLKTWSLEQACSLIKELGRSSFFDDKKFGVYRHGGTVGWMMGIREYPSLSKVLARVVTEICPEAVFTSVLVSCNTPKTMHKDLNNDVCTQNYVIPLAVPEKGGELWIELKGGDTVQGKIEQRVAAGRQVYGQLRTLRTEEAIWFGPRRFHEVADWKGERIVIIAYTPDCLGKLSQEDIQALHEHQFPIPLSQLPEYNGDHSGEEVPPSMRPATVQAEHTVPEYQEGTNQQDESWQMYLDLNPGLVQVDGSDSLRRSPVIQKAEVGFTRNIEEVLSNLSGPLDVVYNVCPDEVMANLDAWRPAIVKEMQGIEVAIERLCPGTESRRRWLNLPGAQKLPMKFVFTIKPNDAAKREDRSTWYKRKARMVICGNLARAEESSLYAETAPAEAVRMALTVASKNQWLVAILDVVAAFIKTPLGRLPTDPIIIAQPPRLLEALGLSERMELWGLVRALYGLREAPMLWTNYRDATLRTMRAPAGLTWQQGRAITSWWSLRDQQGAVVAVVVVYVDDFMICGPRDIVNEVSTIVREAWDTSELSILGPGCVVRFLGMELHRAGEVDDEIYVHQQGYIQELLRSHSVKSSQLDKVPITKDLAALPEECDGAEEDQVRRSQQLTGEVLWLSQRTRPDLAFATSMMASMCTKVPQQTIDIGIKSLGYLQRTMGYQLKVKWSEKPLVMFCDAAYAPQSSRSHGGWLVTYGGVPIVWRSGKQQMITLSTAEAELLAMIDGAIAMKGVESLLSDIGQAVHERYIESDSMAALSISSGSSSWRTRHLRIKANWLQEQISYGLIQVNHCRGEVQPADLLTKALSYARMTSLLQLWGVGQETEAAEEQSSTPRGTGIQVDSDLVGTFMLVLMGLGALLIWEGLKWLCDEIYHGYTPGASKRRLKKLRKLQRATTEAIERELGRLQEQVRTGKATLENLYFDEDEGIGGGDEVLAEQTSIFRDADGSDSESSEFEESEDEEHKRKTSPVQTPSPPKSSDGMSRLKSLIARAKSATEKAEKPDEGSDRIGQVLAKLRASKVEPCNKFVLPGAAPFLYKNGDDDDDGEPESQAEEKASGSKKTKRCKRKTKRCKRKGTDAKKGKAMPSDKGESKEGVAYKPGEYKKMRQDFIKAKTQALGVKPREAGRMWNDSAERAALMSTLSRTEQVEPVMSAGSSMCLGFAKDYDFVELFSGDGEVSGKLRQEGLAGASMDLKDNPTAFDLTTDVGFALALNSILRLRAGGVLVLAICCESFSVMPLGFL
ncbi:unnamed protein product [Symbiodinium sp. KB8]|nr:unnamed protein product [Symbiodinium sp. KB8]